MFVYIYNIYIYIYIYIYIVRHPASGFRPSGFGCVVMGSEIRAPLSSPYGTYETVKAWPLIKKIGKIQDVPSSLERRWCN